MDDKQRWEVARELTKGLPDDWRNRVHPDHALPAGEDFIPASFVELLPFQEPSQGIAFTWIVTIGGEQWYLIITDEDKASLWRMNVEDDVWKAEIRLLGVLAGATFELASTRQGRRHMETNGHCRTPSAF